MATPKKSKPRTPHARDPEQIETDVKSVRTAIVRGPKVGLSRSEIADRTGLDVTQVEHALLRLRMDQAIVKNGDKRGTKYTAA